MNVEESTQGGAVDEALTIRDIRPRKKPEWVPEWAWGEYLLAYRHAIENSGGWADDSEMRIMATARKIATSPHVSSFWRAIRKEHQPCDLSNSGYEEISSGGRFIIVLYGLGWAAMGVPENERFTGTERKQFAAAIRDAAQRLNRALEAISTEYGFPRTFDDVLIEGVPEGESDLESNDDQAETTRGTEAISRYPGTLALLIRAADALEQSSPPVTKVHSDTADQTYFIRQATDVMRTHYHNHSVRQSLR